MATVTPEFAVALGSTVLELALALAIVYIAFRGYRRNDSRPMLFVAVGFFLVIAVPVLLGALQVFLFRLTNTLALGVLGEASRIAGLAAILYGLWTPSR